MIAITKAHIPEYLRGSCFDQAIGDEEDSFEVPADCFKETSSVATDQELHHLLSTLRFWGCDHIPPSVVYYVSLHRPKGVLAAFADFKRELKYLDFLEALCAATEAFDGKPNTSDFSCVQDGCLCMDQSPHIAAAQICLYQYENHGCELMWCSHTTFRAAEFGHLEAVKLLHEYGCPWDEDVCMVAAQKGHVEILRYLHEHGCPWNEQTCIRAACASSLRCLKYAVEHGCPWGDATVAASVPYQHCFYYLSVKLECTSPALCAAAAAQGNLKLLKHLRAKGCAWDETTPATAAQGGYLPILKYAHENGCPWNASTCSSAAASSLECRQYAHEHGCPWDASTTAEACKLRVEYSLHSAATLRYAHENGCLLDNFLYHRIARWNNYEALVYAHQKGLTLDSMAVYIIARYGTSQMLEYLVDNGCTLDEEIINQAIRGEQYESAKLLLEKGCSYEKSTCNAAAKCDVHFLMLVHAHGCPWDESTCAAAARADKLDCLQYLRTHGCPWDIGTVRAAMEGGSLSCLKYAHENGCEWDASQINTISLTSKTRKCIEYVQDHPDRIHIPVPDPPDKNQVPAPLRRSKRLNPDADTTQGNGELLNAASVGATSPASVHSSAAAAAEERGKAKQLRKKRTV